MGNKNKNFATKALKGMKAKVKGETQIQLFLKATQQLLNIAEALDKNHTFDAMIIMKAKGMPNITWGNDILQKSGAGEPVPPISYKKKYTISVKLTKLPIPEEKVVDNNSTD